MVEFIFEVSYCSQERKIEKKFNKYPTVVDILVLFLRKLLGKFGVQGTKDYGTKVGTCEAYQFLIDFFDLNCTRKGKLFLFYEENIYVLADE